MRDALPAGLDFISAQDVLGGDGSFLCGESGGVVTCTGGTLDGSAGLIPGLPTTRTIEVVVRAPQVQQQTFTNQAAVDPFNAIPESNETNNTSRDTLTVTSPYNLSIEKDGPTNAQQNSTQDYVITVTNEKAAVDDVVVVDYLPVGLFPLGVEATGNFACTTSENPVNLVRCVGDMAGNNATATITVHVFVTQNGGVLDNEACVDPDDEIVETDETDNCKTKSTPVTTFRPNISVLKSASAGSVSIGATLSYTLNVTNTGDGPSDTFDVTDDLPAEVSIVGTPTATDGLATCSHDGSATGGLVTCGVTNGLLPGQSTQITITTQVNSGATSAFTNTAKANNGAAVGESASEEPCASNPAACGPETTTENNVDSVTTSVGGASIDLAVGDITDIPDPVAEGNEVTYTTVVVNGGTQDAKAADGNEVVVRVDLPTLGMTLNSVLASQGFACTLTNGDALATCRGDLLAGQSTTITAKLTVGAAAPEQLTVQVTADAVDDITETDETNNTQTEVTTVTHTVCASCIDLQLGQIIAAPNPVTNGGNVTYKFTVTNIGDLPAVPTDPDKLLVSIDLDTTANESTLVSVAATESWTCATNPAFLLDSTEPEILCEAPAAGLLPGGGTTVTLVATANTAFEPSFVDFDVAVDPGNVFPEPVDANNNGGLIVDVVAP